MVHFAPLWRLKCGGVNWPIAVAHVPRLAEPVPAAPPPSPIHHGPPPGSISPPRTPRLSRHVLSFYMHISQKIKEGIRLQSLDGFRICPQLSSRGGISVDANQARMASYSDGDGSKDSPPRNLLAHTEYYSIQILAMSTSHTENQSQPLRSY